MDSINEALEEGYSLIYIFSYFTIEKMHISQEFFNNSSKFSPQTPKH